MHSKSYRSETLTKLANEVRKHKNIYKKRSDPINAALLDHAKNQFKAELVKAHSDWMEKECRNLNHYTGKKFWNQHKSVFGSRSNEGVGFLSADGKIIGDDKNRVEM